MKKILCYLLSICLLASIIPAITVLGKSLENEDSIVVSGMESLTTPNQVISKNIYVQKGATLYITADTTVNGDIYNWGTILVTTNISFTLNGTLNTLRYISFIPTIISQRVDGYDYGLFQSSGNLEIKTLNLSDDYINTQIPNIDTETESESVSEVETETPTDSESNSDITTPCSNTTIISKDTSLSNISTTKNIYIKKGSTLTLSGTSNVSASIYVFGTLKNIGSLTVTGTLNCLNYTTSGFSFSAGNYSYGYLSSTGTMKISKLNVTDSYLAAGIPTLTHTDGSWSITKNATCTDSGEKVKKCTVCSEILETAIIPATGHTAGSWTVTKNATCTVSGQKVQKCVTCGAVLSQSTIPATGHSYSAWKTTTKATIFKEGKQTHTCKNCGKTEKKTIKKLASKVALKATKLTVKKGNTYTLKIKSYTKGDSVSKWSTSNKKIVTVNSKTGKIKGIKKGTTYITVKMKSGCTAMCKITIK